MLERRLPVMSSTRTTMVAGLAIVRNDQLLMVRQARASGMRWELPSGGQEFGETLEETAAREAAEETGLKASAGPLIATFTSYRPQQQAVVLGAIYRGELDEVDSQPTPQLSDGIVAAAFVDPYALPREELGALTIAVLRRWWSERDRELCAWHIELCRDVQGYRGVDSATTELRPIVL
ncbi:MAG: hypothetical protein DLM55_04070 [Acidimicrobiales bacterium]|nr:MAG: hypothetical protein DLM55_04070 [Acidimicrobiales bacterium]